MTAKKLLSASFLLCLFTSCEDRINVSPKSEHTDLLVVQGILTNEKTRHTIRLSHPFETSNGAGSPVSGATVIVSGANQVFHLTESPAGSGYYLTDSMIAVVATDYRLSIQFQGKQYFAEDRSDPVEPLPPLSYQPAGSEQFYRLTPARSGSSANYVDHQISWKGTVFCNAGGSCEGEVIFYDLKTTDVNDIYKPSKEEFDFPQGSTITRKKYSTSPAYRAFLRAILSETEWRGGIFDVERDNAPTNLSEGAIGFFAVSTVVSDSTVIP